MGKGGWGVPRGCARQAEYNKATEPLAMLLCGGTATAALGGSEVVACVTKGSKP